MKKSKYILEIIINTSIIFLSYLIAVVIRYKILESEPGINALSAPYLMIAAVYSLIMACTFDYEEQPRWNTKSSGLNGFYGLISKNAVGCLLLLSVFYFTGLVYFSRWALLLFWIISCGGLMLKKAISYSLLVKRRRAGKDNYNVLIIGDGKMARRYVSSVTKNPCFGIKIVGYMGESEKLKTNTDGMFDVDEYSDPVIRKLGKYSIEEAERIIIKEKVDEIIIADYGLTEDEAKHLLKKAHENNVKTSISMRYSPLIKNETKIKDMGSIKTTGLNETITEKNPFVMGVLVTFALLFLIMMMSKFNMGVMTSLRGLESYRAVLFALFGFFMFLCLTDAFSKKKFAFLIRIGVSVLVSAVLIIGYEFIYSNKFWGSVGIDFLVTGVVLFACLVISGVSEILGKSDMVFFD